MLRGLVEAIAAAPTRPGSSSCWSTSARRRSPSGSAGRGRQRSPPPQPTSSPPTRSATRSWLWRGQAAGGIRRGRGADRRFPHSPGGRLRGSRCGEARVRRRARDRGPGRRVAHGDRHGARRDRGFRRRDGGGRDDRKRRCYPSTPSLPPPASSRRSDVAGCAVSGEESLRTEPGARRGSADSVRELHGRSGRSRRAPARADRVQLLQRRAALGGHDLPSTRFGSRRSRPPR